MARDDLSRLRLEPHERQAGRRLTAWVVRIVAVLVGVAILVVLVLGRRVPDTTDAVALADTSVTDSVAASAVRPRAPRAVAAGGYVEAKRRAMLYPGRDGVVARVHVALGERVTRGELLLELDTAIAAAETAAARADVNASAAELADARLARDRLEQLVTSGAATQDEVDRARYRVQRLEAQLESFAARAELAAARLELSYLRAPFDGAIVRVDLEPGEVVSLFGVQSGAGGIEIADLSEIWVRVDVPEDRLGTITMGAPAEVVVDALGDATLAAEVVEIAPVADRQSNTVEVAVRVLDPPALLRPDMSARVTIRVTGDSGE